MFFAFSAFFAFFAALREKYIHPKRRVPMCGVGGLVYHLRLMDILLIIKTVIMGIVEGLTEFLPVSSTGHLIVADALMNYSAGIGGKETAATFEIFIQLGAILAVVVYFARDLAALLRRALHEDAARRVLVNVAIAFVPAAAIGFLAKDFIKGVLFSTPTVGVALIFGGVIMLWVEGRDHRSETIDVEQMSFRQALAVGVAQVAALIPGMSRSASTLIGGLFNTFPPGWIGLRRCAFRSICRFQRWGLRRCTTLSRVEMRSMPMPCLCSALAQRWRSSWR